MAHAIVLDGELVFPQNQWINRPSSCEKKKPPAPQTVGELIRFHRLRQRQIHNSHPWAQEDLAVAIGSDKSHICRLECGRQQPSPETLLRICDALGLSWIERTELFALAGYLLPPPQPTTAEMEKAVQSVRPFLQTASYPAALLDVEARLLDFNEIHARSFYWNPDAKADMPELRGQRIIDLIINPKTSEWLRRVVVDFRTYARRQLVYFWYAFRDRQGNPEYQEVLRRLLSIRDLESIWLEITAKPPRDDASPYASYQSIVVHHPYFGRFTQRIWHSTLFFDDRFLVAHMLPADAATHQLFAEISAQIAGDSPLMSTRRDRRVPGKALKSRGSVCR